MLWAAWVSPLAARGRTLGSAPHSQSPPGTLGHSLQPAPGPGLADVWFIHPLAAPYIRSAARTPGHAVAIRDADDPRFYFANNNCPGYAFLLISFQTFGGAAPVPCKSSAKPPTPLSPNQGISMPSALPMCTASCEWCSAVTCLSCLLLQRACTPHARVPAASESGVRRSPPLKFRTRHMGAAMGFVRVRGYLSSG
jgi:hypothetical protein